MRIITNFIAITSINILSERLTVGRTMRPWVLVLRLSNYYWHSLDSREFINNLKVWLSFAHGTAWVVSWFSYSAGMTATERCLQSWRKQESSEKGMVARAGGRLVALYLFSKALWWPSYSNRTPYTSSSIWGPHAPTWERFRTQTLCYRQGNCTNFPLVVS